MCEFIKSVSSFTSICAYFRKRKFSAVFNIDACGIIRFRGEGENKALNNDAEKMCAKPKFCLYFY